jgi:hypothetical protein
VNGGGGAKVALLLKRSKHTKLKSSLNNRTTSSTCVLYLYKQEVNSDAPICTQRPHSLLTIKDILRVRAVWYVRCSVRTQSRMRLGCAKNSLIQNYVFYSRNSYF